MRNLQNLYLFVVVFLCTLGFLHFRMHVQQTARIGVTLPQTNSSISIKGDSEAVSAAAAASVLGRAGGPKTTASTSPSLTSPSLEQKDDPGPTDEEYQFQPVEDVNIAVQSGHFFGNDFEGLQPNCTIGKTVINCRYGASLDANTADGLWYHIPSLGSTDGLVKRHPKQLLIGMSMESSEYYPALDNKDYMKAFDIESSYRTCSQVPVFYFDYNEAQVGLEGAGDAPTTTRPSHCATTCASLCFPHPLRRNPFVLAGQEPVPAAKEL